MSYQACKEYLAAIVDGYKKANKSKKTEILTQAEEITGLTRKHLIRLLKSSEEKLMTKIFGPSEKIFSRHFNSAHPIPLDSDGANLREANEGGLSGLVAKIPGRWFYSRDQAPAWAVLAGN